MMLARKIEQVRGAESTLSSLQRIVEAIASGKPLQPIDADILLAGIAVGSVDFVLGLRPAPGQRSPATRLAQIEHRRLLCNMADTFFAGQSITAAAESIAPRLARYRAGPDWKRDRTAETIEYRDTLRGHCWAVLKAVDRPLSARRIRAVLAMS